MNMNPASVASARTARLAAEAAQAQAPRLAYSTATPAREHLFMVEWDSPLGGRFWTRPMPESKAQANMAEAGEFGSYYVSDYDHASACWCGGAVDVWA